MDVVWRVWGSRTPRISVKGFGVPASLNPSNEQPRLIEREAPPGFCGAARQAPSPAKAGKRGGGGAQGGSGLEDGLRPHRPR